MSKVRVGIDFGTTTSTVVVVLPNGQLTPIGPEPSLVAWENYQVVAFGREARARVEQGSPPYPLRDLKMHLDNGFVRVGPQRLDVVPLVSQYLENLLKIAKVWPEGDLEVVIGTPVRVSRQHRIRLRQACEAIGLTDVRLIYEPTAALLGNVEDLSLLAFEPVVVVDWGGGTLDVAIIRVDENRGFQELAVDGDVNDLGGSRMDQEIARRLVASSPRARRAVEALNHGFDVLVERIEVAKIDLLQEDGEASDRFIPGFPEAVFLPAELVYAVASEFTQRAREAIAAILDQAGIPTSEVTKVFFAGGVSQSPLIRREIMTLFPEAEPIALTPQLSTALGCARLAQNSFSLELATDFGVRQSDDSICILLRRGQSVMANAYREAEFMVTDVHADEALFDFGICHFEEGRASIWAADGSSFRSLHQTFIRVTRSDLARGNRIPDRVKVFTGLDEYLTVAAFLKSLRGGASKQEYITGVPLRVRVDDRHA
jgi:molecular chaperone DnaK